MQGRLEHALKLAELGFYIFPVEENSKLPLLPWRKNSSRNPETIKNWWKCPHTGWLQNHNIGIDTGKSGVLVVDIDRKQGKQGERSREELELYHGFGAPLIVDTPSGGLHYYYRATQLFRNTQGDKGGIAPGIDTRGDGGYVLAPGSDIDGKYYEFVNNSVLDVEHLPPIPEWLVEKLSTHKAVGPADREVLTEDKTDDVDRAADYLKTADPAIEGAGGNHHTFAVAAKVRELGVSRDMCLALMLDHWNDRCSPPWLVDDLEKVINNAYQYAKKAVGAASPHAEFEAMPVQEEPDFAERAELVEPNSIPLREWLFGHLALKKKVTLLVAPGGAGKSTLSLSIAISKVTGRNLLGMDPHGQGAVWVYNNEDDMEEMNRRVAAVLQHHGIKREEMMGEKGCNLFMNSGEKQPLRIAKRNRDGVLKPEDADKLVKSIKKHNIQLLIVDPFAETHPADENSNREILEIARMYRYVAQFGDCSVILIHHTRKPDNASSEGQSGNMDVFRGASSLGGVARIIATFFGMNSKEAKGYGIAEELRSKYVLLEYAKANMSAPGADRMWFERVSERISISMENPDGEAVGVLKPIKLAARKDAPNDAIKALAVDIEGMCSRAGDKGLTVKELVDRLISEYPLHMDKQPATLEKAVRRLFDNGTVDGAGGVMFISERPQENRKRPLSYIHWAPRKSSAIDELC